MSAQSPEALRADPLADATIARVFEALPGQDTEAVAIVNRNIAQWQSNGGLASWRADPATPAPIAAALEAYVQAAMRLPEWADSARIDRAETTFYELSMMSCTLLFCASLPQCYVVPDLSAVLHAAGQLEAHADYRIRSTAAMIFPVMMKGGLTSSDGTGIAQILKVRLIHATVRHLILHGTPEDAVRTCKVVAPCPTNDPSLVGSLRAHGWNVERDGLPCNQQELAYTLLTFHYIYLRGLRTLGIGLKPADEQAYLHAWNVVGHVLGIERALMAETMEAAEALFTRLQDIGRSHPYTPDPRPALGASLMKVMEDQLPLRILKPVPVLMTRYLCGTQTSKDLGITGRVPPLSRILFDAGISLTRAVDAVVRLFVPEFSLCRMLTRVVGYHFTVRVLMDQTRPLKLPAALLNEVHGAVRDWHRDPKAPGWVNAVEAKLTSRSAQAQESQAC